MSPVRAAGKRQFAKLNLQNVQRYEEWTIEVENMLSGNPQQLEDLCTGLLSREDFAARHHEELDDESPYDMAILDKRYAAEIDRYNSMDHATYGVVLDAVDISTSARLRTIVRTVKPEDRSGRALYDEIRQMTSVGTPGNQAQLQDELATVTLSVRDGSPIFEEA
jgi:hypothetical protein